jgi:hypothetical protein
MPVACPVILMLLENHLLPERRYSHNAFMLMLRRGGALKADLNEQAKIVYKERQFDTVVAWAQFALSDASATPALLGPLNDNVLVQGKSISKWIKQLQVKPRRTAATLALKSLRVSVKTEEKLDEQLSDSPQNLLQNFIVKPTAALLKAVPQKVVDAPMRKSHPLTGGVKRRLAPVQWSTSQVVEWLTRRGANLAQYADSFKANCVNGAVLCEAFGRPRTTTQDPAKAPKLKPLTDAEIQDMLGIRNPLHYVAIKTEARRLFFC